MRSAISHRHWFSFPPSIGVGGPVRRAVRRTLSETESPSLSPAVTARRELRGLGVVATPNAALPAAETAIRPWYGGGGGFPSCSGDLLLHISHRHFRQIKGPFRREYLRSRHRFARRTTLMFSCDIAYSRSPTASRAGPTPPYNRTLTTRPSRKSATCAKRAEATGTPLPAPIPCARVIAST